MLYDPAIIKRKEQLISETKVTLSAIQKLSKYPERDAFTDPEVLALAVTSGILDAPQLKNNRFGKGQIKTRIIGGACLAVDDAGKPISELQRLEKIFTSGGIERK